MNVRIIQIIQYMKTVLWEVQIANEVVAIIAGIAANRSRRCRCHGRRYSEGIGQQTWNEGFIQGCAYCFFEDDGIRVDLSIILEYGCSIPEVTAAVQDRVKSSIETMTGLKVSDVNIRVADVKIDNE